MNRLILLLTISLFLSACANNKPYLLGDTGEDGLAPVKNTDLDELAIRPNRRFDQYTKVLIEPISVTYDKQRRTDSLSLHRRPEDFQLDEKELEIFNKKFVKAFQKRWSETQAWELTDTPGKDVITARATITDFYLYASIKNDTVLPHETLANESSRMTLNLELIDSQNGEVLLRSKDKKTTGWSNSSTLPLRRFNSVRYWGDAYQAFSQWAAQLSKYLKTPS